jgi:hypothetical protein
VSFLRGVIGILEEGKMKDFRDLKVGDRVGIHYLGLLMKNLLVTHVNDKVLHVEYIYYFDRKTGTSCDNNSDNMYLVRGDMM